MLPTRFRKPLVHIDIAYLKRGVRKCCIKLFFPDFLRHFLWGMLQRRFQARYLHDKSDRQAPAQGGHVATAHPHAMELRC